MLRGVLERRSTVFREHATVRAPGHMKARPLLTESRVASLVVLSALLSGCDSFKPPASMESLPVNVRKALLDLCRQCEFADAGAPWNRTDMVPDERPQRHLRRIEHTEQGWLIEYDHGGYFPHEHTVVFELEPTVHVGRGSSCNPTETKCEW